MASRVGGTICNCDGFIEGTCIGAVSNSRGSSVAAEELLDEDDHLGLLDSARVVLVEGLEHFVKGLIGELVTGTEVAEGVLHELLGLLLVEGTGVVNVIGGPDLVDDSLDGLFFSGHLVSNNNSRSQIN